MKGNGGDFYRTHFFSYLCTSYQDNSIADTNCAFECISIIENIIYNSISQQVLISNKQ